MFRSKTFKCFLGFLFFGSIWGFSEATFGDWLYSQEIPHASIYLATIAFIIIASSKVFLSYRWTGTLIGLIAMLFKLVNVPFFACHLLAIFLLGAGFDIACELVNRFYRERFSLPIIGMVGNYIGRVLFAVIITYVVQYYYWTEVGLPKVIDYIFISGSISALVGAVAVPIGNLLGKNVREFSWPKLHPRFAIVSVLAGTLGIWILQQAI